MKKQLLILGMVLGVMGPLQAAARTLLPQFNMVAGSVDDSLCVRCEGATL